MGLEAWKFAEELLLWSKWELRKDSQKSFPTELIRGGKVTVGWLINLNGEKNQSFGDFTNADRAHL